jgi:4-diphosphocytidyl-2-C-methyl-D-erythritol kinase
MMIFRAHAKVNLYLDVLRKREDGYHDILTLFQSISLADELSIEKAEGIWVECDMPGLPSGEMNLAYRAAKLLMDIVRLRAGVRVEIRKRIPIGAGLGGGSADAAAVLIGMNELFDLRLPMEALMDLGSEIGADVPFCIMGGTALGEGIGDRLTRLPFIGEIWFLLANPGIHISTGWAYRSLRLTEPKENANILIQRFKGANSPETVSSLLYNLFETVVFPEYPEVARLKDRVMELGALGALMSGSGSTVFGIFNSKEEAEDAQKVLSDEVPFCTVACAVKEGIVKLS